MATKPKTRKPAAKTDAPRRAPQEVTGEPKTKIQDAQDCITAAKHLLRLMEIASEELEMGNVLDDVEISRDIPSGDEAWCP